jgi:hypothetical protein
MNLDAGSLQIDLLIGTQVSSRSPSLLLSWTIDSFILVILPGHLRMHFHQNQHKQVIPSGNFTEASRHDAM